MADLVEIELLARADMNLLVAFEAMMQERSVTRAARRLALSQSAMSHTLRRMRDLFDDELFVRVGQEMVPTPHAVRMAPAVAQALAAVAGVLRPEREFRPAELNATFEVHAFDFAQVVLLPALARHLARVAPGVRLVVRAYDEDVGRVLAEGSADLVIGLEREPQEVCQRILSTERFACAVRADHPCLAGPLTTGAFAELTHALVSPIGRPRGFVDGVLAELGLDRDVAFATPQLFSAALAVAGSDMILTAAQRHLSFVAPMLDLVVIAPPVELPAFNVAMTWHERRTHDEAHRFVRDALVEIAANEELSRAGSP